MSKTVTYFLSISQFFVKNMLECPLFLLLQNKSLLIDLPPRSAGQAFISKIGHHFRTSDDNDLEHVMNTENSLETCPFATFRPPPTFYNLYKLFFFIV